MSDEELPRRDFARAFETSDMTIAQDGDGRTVDAYITPFNSPNEIRDAEGHYHETVGNTAFTKTLAERGLNFQVLYNHGKTYDGRTDGALMIPIGVPKVVQPHDAGLFSSTRYLDNPLADAALDGIKQGAIRGYSYQGTFMKSQRTAAASRSALPSIHRSEVAMRDYGPVLFPAHTGAAVLGTRSVSVWLDELSRLDPEDIDAFRQMLGIATPLGAGDAAVTPEGADQTVTPEAGAGQPPDQTTPPGAGQPTDDPAERQSRQIDHLRTQIAARNRARGVLK